MSNDGPQGLWHEGPPAGHRGLWPPSGSLTPPPDLPQMPHCDSSILHRPGECQFCDMHPDWQQYREMARINFTGQADEGKAPCPSNWFRPASARDRWPGNVPAPAGEPVPSYFEPLTDQEAYTAAAERRWVSMADVTRFGPPPSRLVAWLRRTWHGLVKP